MIVLKSDCRWKTLEGFPREIRLGLLGNVPKNLIWEMKYGHTTDFASFKRQTFYIFIEMLKPSSMICDISNTTNLSFG
jgi:hypothetical protein